MKRRRTLVLSLLLAFVGFSGVNGQTDAVFSSVPVVNGKVIFQQFIPNTDGANAAQQYARLQQWGKNRFQGKPLLSGIRYDDKGRSVTISAGEELRLPANGGGSVTMRYRFDTSVTNAGYTLVIRDITYQQSEQPGSTSVFPKTYSAEQMITDQAVSAAGAEKELRNNTRKATLAFLNNLYEELSAL